MSSIISERVYGAWKELNKMIDQWTCTIGKPTVGLTPLPLVESRFLKWICLAWTGSNASALRGCKLLELPETLRKV